VSDVRYIAGSKRLAAGVGFWPKNVGTRGQSVLAEGLKGGDVTDPTIEGENEPLLVEVGAETTKPGNTRWLLGLAGAIAALAAWKYVMKVLVPNVRGARSGYRNSSFVQLYRRRKYDQALVGNPLLPVQPTPGQAPPLKHAFSRRVDCVRHALTLLGKVLGGLFFGWWRWRWGRRWSSRRRNHAGPRLLWAGVRWGPRWRCSPPSDHAGGSGRRERPVRADNRIALWRACRFFGHCCESQ
jgi:hypothetical protein